MKRLININTEVPGPNSRAWLAKVDRFLPKGIGIHIPVIVDRAQGALVTDVDGNTFIDMTSGIGVLNVGHANQRVVEAIREQSARFTHTDFTNVAYASLIGLAERLVPRVPGSGPKKAFFFNSGAEAVENAVKFARLYTGRPAVIAFEGGFHGRTLMALSLTGRARPYKAGLGPFAPEVYRLPYPYLYRKPEGLTDEAYGEVCAEALERAFYTQVAADDVAAVIVEPVQGEGGVVVPPPNFLRRVQEICRRHGIVFIVDEIQTGFGRTGRWFAAEHFELDPDLVCLAKSLAGGLPLSAVVGKAEVMDAAPSGSVGGTFVGNPVACAAALAVIEEMEAKDLPARAERIGAQLRRRLEALAARYPLVGDVRGLGAMVAIELVKDRRTKVPATAETDALIQLAMRRGVLLLKAGLYGNVVRMLPPLVITEAEVDEAVDVVEGCLTELS